MHAISQHLRIFGTLAVSALIIFLATFASAQESTITFPVAELGNCGNKSECRAYCDDLAHVNECVAFAEAHGLMDAQEAKAAREFARLGGEGPGGCTSKNECESYCEDPAHLRQCIDFARQAGLMDERELEEAEKVASYVEQGGALPGGCRGERECKAYCEDESHAEECVAFAEKAGFMSPEEVAMFKKTGGKGPGGCKGRACEAYCEDEANREQCVAFALEHDLMSPEDKRRMEEGKERAKEAIEKAPPEVLSCIEAALGSAEVEKARSGQSMNPRLGQVLPECFRSVMGGSENRGPFGPGSAASDCMRKVFGDDFEKKMRSGELDPGARDGEIRECMQSQMREGFLNDAGQWERPLRGEPGEGPQGFGPPGNVGPEGMGPDDRRFGPQGDMRPGDVVRTEDMRFGPLPGEDRGPRETQMRKRYAPTMREGFMPGERDRFDEQYKEEYRQQFDTRRAEMERQMRAEIESQMRSGNFDPSKLPQDFRPEGAFPPPESFNRPPGGFDMSGQPPAGSGMPGMPPPGGMTPGGMMPGGTMPPEGFAPPAEFTQPMTQPVPPSEPVSNRDRFLAGVATVLLSLFGL
jgi:hypothetical protein